MIEALIAAAIAESGDGPEVIILPSGGEELADDADRRQRFAAGNKAVLSHVVSDDAGRQYRIVRIEFQELPKG